MKHQTRILLLLSAIAMVCATVGAQGQVVIGGEQQYDIDYLTPKQYEIGGITIENADRLDHRMVLMVAGLQVGDKVAIPGDKISTAIDNLWKQGLFEDVKIVVTRIQGDKVFLKIVLRERPKLLKFAIKGVKGDDAKKLRDDMNIATGDVVTENMLQTTTNIIRSYYLEKGFSNVEVNTTTTPDTTDGKDNQVVVTYNVHRGKRVKIDSLILEGNTQVPTNKILRTIIEKFKGGPVGANTLATAISEDQGTYEEVYEPFLIKEGFILRTQRGRIATDLAYRHLGFDRSGNEGETLF